MHRSVFPAFVIICLATFSSFAQTEQPRSPVLVIDQDRLFTETQPGARSAAAIEIQAQALANENRRIEEELSVEERELTERRSGLSPAEFSGLADAFDAKVQSIRAEQDAKARTLAARQEDARQRFFVEISGILSEIVQERGADVVLNQRDVFLSADRIDITDDVIARINARAAETEDGQTDEDTGDGQADQ